MEERKTDLIKLTGLWKNESRKGISYLSGSLTYSSKLLIFKNNKRGDSDPDYIAYLAPNNVSKEKEEDAPEQGVEERIEDKINSEELPF